MVGLDVARKDGEIHFIRRQLIHEVETFCGLEIKWHTPLAGDHICYKCAEITDYEDFEEIVVWDD